MEGKFKVSLVEGEKKSIDAVCEAREKARARTKEFVKKGEKRTSRYK